MPCDVKLLTKCTYRGVRARTAGRDQYSHSVTSGGNRFGIGPFCFNGAVDASEEIDLVSHLKQILVQPDGPRTPAGELENLVRDGIAPAQRAGSHIGRRIATGMHDIYGSARRGQVCVSGGEVAVRLERFLYQSIETRIVVQVPPGI